MTLDTYLERRNMTKYQLSKISGIPKTTVLDICAGRSSVERCSAKTIQQLARALNCSMEDIWHCRKNSRKPGDQRITAIWNAAFRPFCRNPYKRWPKRGESWMQDRNTFTGTAISAVCKATSTVRKSINLSARNRHGISEKSIYG